MITSEMPPAGPSSAAARSPAQPDTEAAPADASFATFLGAPQAAQPAPFAIDRPVVSLTEPDRRSAEAAAPEGWASWLAGADAEPQLPTNNEIVAPEGAQALPETPPSEDTPPAAQTAGPLPALPEVAALYGPAQAPAPAPTAKGATPKPAEQIETQEIAPPESFAIPQPEHTDLAAPDAPDANAAPLLPPAGLPLVEAAARAEPAASAQAPAPLVDAAAPSAAPAIAGAAAPAIVRAAAEVLRTPDALRASENATALDDAPDAAEPTAPAASERAAPTPAPVPAPTGAQPAIPTAPVQMTAGEAPAQVPESARTEAEPAPASSPAAATSISTAPTAATVQAAFAAAAPSGPIPIADDGVTLAPSDAPSWQLSARDGAAAVERALQVAAAAPRDITGQITLAVTNAAQPEIEIRLDPPELGRVQLRLNPTEGGGIQAIVTSERPETQDFLRRHADALVRDLNAAGYAQVTLGFAAGGDAHAQTRRDTPGERRYTGGFDPAPTGAVAATAPEAPRRRSADSLDIRL